ncbi:MAG: polysaccharide deacetylase family protein [Candidatus Falkowbacteria bacterium]
MNKKILFGVIFILGLVCVQPALAIPDAKVPILMYHYIRNYHSPKDKIGERLSVSPADFAAQLDLIQRAGYQTAVFADAATTSPRLPSKTIILTFDDGYRDFYTAAFPELKKRRMKAVVYPIYSVIGTSDYLTKEMITEMLASGLVEIGSHTLNHLDLTHLKPAKLQAEVFQSKLNLERDFGIKILSLCYPYGIYDRAVIAAAKRAGYLYALDTKTGQGDWASPYEMKRYRVDDSTNLAGLLRALGGPSK